MKKYFLFFALNSLFFVATLHAQTVDDALRYSFVQPQGTARFMGVGNSMSALGSDYSVVSTNPGGLATFRKSEVVASLGFSNNNTDATLRTENDRNNFGINERKFVINNIGLVIHNKMPRRVLWKSLNFAVGFNRIANFNQQMYYQGATGGSLADSFAEAAQGISPEELNGLGTSLAYQTGAIYDFSGGTNYVTDFTDFPDVPVLREETRQTTGSINELTFSLASNYNNFILFGATLGIPILSWELDRMYSEEDSANDDVPFFNNLIFNEEVSTSGAGVNLKLGLIFRISQMLRLGVAVHTPTGYALTDEFQNTMTYSFTEYGNASVFNEASPPGDFSYRLRTPWRYLLSGAVVIQKFGFVSAEVEYLNMGNANFKYPEEDVFSQNTLNNTIENTLQSVLILKLGAEYALQKFRFRAGFNINGSPFAEGSNASSTFTLGTGLRLERFYADLAFRTSSTEGTYAPYTTTFAPQPTIDTRFVNNDFIITLGYRF